MKNCLLNSAAEVFGKISGVLTSKIALIVYAAIVLILLIVLVVRIAFNEQKRKAGRCKRS